MFNAMATRYTVEALLQLRESPLCTKPSTLPPAEEWMGPPPDTLRNAQGTGRNATDRSRNDGALLDNTNRRSGVERHVSRNSANPDDIILGPPRTTFSSATLSRGSKPSDNDKTSDRFRDRDRDVRGNFRRRGENADQDSDGWSTVKPRKSFGHEGAERFRPERFGGDRRSKDIQEEPSERPPRRNNFGEFSRDKDAEEGERPRRNGLNRNRADQPSWSRGGNVDTDPAPPRERFDRAKSWRDRDDQGGENQPKPRERNFDRRWDHRDQRQEREPEWMDEPAESTPKGHTEEDFKRFMESMKGKKEAGKADTTAAPAAIETAGSDENTAPEKPKLKAVTTMEMGPDKFFANFAQSPSTELGTPLEGARDAGPLKLKTASRFQNFFSSQEIRQKSQPSTPIALAPAQEPNPLLALANAGPNPGLPVDAEPSGQSDAAEKVAFQALLQKLQKQSLQGTPPAAGFTSPPAAQGMGPKNAVTSPGPFAQYGQELRGDSLSRGVPQPNPDIHAPRPQQMAQSSLMRQEEDILQELMRQQQQQQQQQQRSMPNPGPARAGHNQSRNGSSNTEFLMTLMQSARNMPEPPRAEQLIRMPQPSRPAQIPPTPDREPDYHRDRGMHGRPPAMPAFFDDVQLHHQEQESRRQQPTQILQRQVPPGLDQINPASWMGNQQLPPGPGRPMIPPPGLAGNPRNGPMPGMFPPNFQMSGFPHPDAPAGPPRNMAPPPGFFGAGPPPGFMPPHPGMGGFQGGPEALAFGYDGRGMPPPGAFRRG